MTIGKTTTIKTKKGTTIDLGFKPHKFQLHALQNITRFYVLVCHRRWGKTVLAIMKLNDAALKCQRVNPKFGYVAPFRNQAKEIAWGYLKDLASKMPGVKVNESELSIHYSHNNAIIRLYGADNPDAIRGAYLDPLIKMAVIHHQFESIHPFYDGNGRVWRIINILYLIINNLQTLPILYLSRYIIANKSQYYQLLNDVRENNVWEEWILFILDGIEKTAKQTVSLVEKISELMQFYKHELKSKFPKMYSHELINNLFCHPYTKVDFLQQDIGVSRVTAMKYLNQGSRYFNLKY